MLVLVFAGRVFQTRGDLLEARVQQHQNVEYVYREDSPFRSAHLAVSRAIVGGDEVRVVSQVPSPRVMGGWVVDLAGVLNAETVQDINDACDEVRRRTGGEVAVVIMPKVRGGKTAVKPFTTALFNHWGLGDRYKNNGVVVFVSVGDRRVEIEVGKGLNLPFNRGKWLRRTIDEHIIPAFGANQWNRGTFAAVDSVCNKLIEVDAEVSSPSWCRNLSSACNVAFAASAIALAFTLLNLKALPPKCTTCGKRTTRLRAATLDELSVGEQTEVKVGSVSHTLCGCCRPSCWQVWASPPSLKVLPDSGKAGGRRVGGAIRRSSRCG